MVWDHKKKLKELAVASMNQPGIHRLVKVVPHQPGRQPALRVRGWVSQEKYIIGDARRGGEDSGIRSPPRPEYLPHGFDVYVITEQIGEDDFELKGAYTHLPEGREWDAIDLHWPPGLGATQWALERDVTCRFIKTVPRGQRY
jgi:hypothetical protein